MVGRILRAAATACTVAAVSLAAGCTGTTAPPARPPARTEGASGADRGDRAAVTPAVASADADVPAGDALARRLAAAADGDERVRVIDEIGAVGQNARSALTALVAALADADPRTRWHAARAIGLIGEDSRTALPRLVELLADPDPIVVTQAAAALGSIREDDGRDPMPAADAAGYAAVVEPLASTALHADPRARRAALRALRHYAAPAEMAPIVSRHLADAEPAVVVSALQSLAGSGAAAVPLLVEALGDPKSRYWAAVALADVGPEAAAATEPLARLVSGGGPEERLQAILALAAIGEPASPAAPSIVGALESDDAALTLAAAFALGRLRSPAGDVRLRALAAGRDDFTAGVAAWALARIHPDDASLLDAAVNRLRAGLAGPDPQGRAAAVDGLSDLASRLGEDARGGLAADFVGLLADPDAKVGRAAGAAVIRLGGAAVPALRTTLADPALRGAALEILAGIGPAAKPALADLVGALGDADAGVRGDAALAIAAIGGEAAEAVPRLVALASDASTETGVRYAAVYALGKIGPAAGAAETVVGELAGSEDEMLATVATWAALKIRPGDAARFESAVPMLRRGLRGDTETVRLEAAIALGDIGTAAESAIPLLELVAEDDPVKRVREAAAAAVARIRGK